MTDRPGHHGHALKRRHRHPRRGQGVAGASAWGAIALLAAVVALASVARGDDEGAHSHNHAPVSPTHWAVATSQSDVRFYFVFNFSAAIVVTVGFVILVRRLCYDPDWTRRAWQPTLSAACSVVYGICQVMYWVTPNLNPTFHDASDESPPGLAVPEDTLWRLGIFFQIFGTGSYLCSVVLLELYWMQVYTDVRRNVEADIPNLFVSSAEFSNLSEEAAARRRSADISGGASDRRGIPSDLPTRASVRGSGRSHQTHGKNVRDLAPVMTPIRTGVKVLTGFFVLVCTVVGFIGIFTDIGDVAEVVLYVAIVALWGLLGVIVPVYCYGLWKAFNPDGCETIDGPRTKVQLRKALVHTVAYPGLILTEVFASYVWMWAAGHHTRLGSEGFGVHNSVQLPISLFCHFAIIFFNVPRWDADVTDRIRSVVVLRPSTSSSSVHDAVINPDLSLSSDDS